MLRAISAIDVAIWDAVSKEAGLPLYRYLGAYHEGTVPVYASGGYYGGNKTLVDLSTEMRGYVEMGFTAVKMKVGMLPMSEDVERVKTARETVGPDIPLFLDANNAWPDSVSAIQAIRAFEPYTPGWIEEPLMPDDIRGHARITDAVDTPVATGEIHATRWEFLDLIEREAAQVIQPDAGVCGGITEWRRIAGIAASHAIPVAPHWLADLHAHLVAATPNATWVEYFTDFSGKKVTLGLRPEDIVTSNPGDQRGFWCPLHANVAVVQLLGADSILHLDCNGHEMLARVDSHGSYHIGEEVRVHFNMSRAHLFDSDTGEAI